MQDHYFVFASVISQNIVFSITALCRSAEFFAASLISLSVSYVVFFALNFHFRTFLHVQ